MIYQFKEFIPVIDESAFIHPQSLVGNPAKIIRQISDEMIAWKSEGTKIYQQLAMDMKNEWKVCEPLRKAPAGIDNSETVYKTWDELKKKK